MKHDLEFEGRSIEEAVERALEELGRKRGQIEYDVLEDGKKGFLGIGARMARIRVRADTGPAAAVPGPAGRVSDHAANSTRAAPSGAAPGPAPGIGRPSAQGRQQGRPRPGSGSGSG